MSRLLRKTGFYVLTLALAAACDDDDSDPFDDEYVEPTTEVRVDASVYLPGDGGAPPLDGAARADAAQAYDAGPFSPPDASLFDRGLNWSQRNVGCATTGRTCLLGDGSNGICLASGDCGGCAQTSECLEVYGNGFQCDANNSICLPPQI